MMDVYNKKLGSSRQWCVIAKGEAGRASGSRRHMWRRLPPLMAQRTSHDGAGANSSSKGKNKMLSVRTDAFFSIRSYLLLRLLLLYQYPYVMQLIERQKQRFYSAVYCPAYYIRGFLCLAWKIRE